MRFRLLSCFLLSVFTTHAQPTDTSKWLRAFPITGYIVDGNDSTKIVQLEMPENITLKEKTLGLLYGVYNTSKEEAVEKGYGRCQLIKGNYHYFAITNNKSGQPIKGGDIIYTLLPKTTIYYGYIPKLAGHFIRLTDVYDSAFYDRYFVFNNWTDNDDGDAIMAMLKDIQFTGGYFRENNAAMDVLIKSGDYKGQTTFNLMIDCTPKMLEDFFEYIFVRPRNYAGREWKVSEIFATWLSEGAPTLVKE
jgi:hypothetical protein